MKTKFDRVYVFKITLKGIKPPIWRRIEVPEAYTFWDLHVAIQDAMGWQDYHLHEFEMRSPSTDGKDRIGIPDKDFDWGARILPGWKKKIPDYFSVDNPAADYTYDFGDNWEHKVRLEKILPRAEGLTYPRCTAGKRTCPPDDCGGVWGYMEMLEALKDPSHERHEEFTAWLGGEFQPEHFDPKEVVFDDPQKRRRMA